jgi:hypothetical protein
MKKGLKGVEIPNFQNFVRYAHIFLVILMYFFLELIVTMASFNIPVDLETEWLQCNQYQYCC